MSHSADDLFRHILDETSYLIDKITQFSEDDFMYDEAELYGPLPHPSFNFI